MLESCLPVFRHAGDLRRVSRTLIELACHGAGRDPAAAAGFLLQAPGQPDRAGTVNAALAHRLALGCLPDVRRRGPGRGNRPADGRVPALTVAAPGGLAVTAAQLAASRDRSADGRWLAVCARGQAGIPRAYPAGVPER